MSFIGTGKSLLLRAIIAALRKKYAKKPECISVTASTGMAALNIGCEYLSFVATRHGFDTTVVVGTTIHAWGAITPGMHDVGKLVSYIKTCKPAFQRWKTTKVLIIDEGTLYCARAILKLNNATSVYG